jgi:hypothetical protein
MRSVYAPSPLRMPKPFSSASSPGLSLALVASCSSRSSILRAVAGQLIGLV